MNHYSALDLKSSMIITVSQNTNFWPEILDILHVLQNQVHLITVESWRTLDEGEYCIVTFAQRIQKLALWGIFPSLQPEEGSQKILYLAKTRLRQINQVYILFCQVTDLGGQNRGFGKCISEKWFQWLGNRCNPTIDWDLNLLLPTLANFDSIDRESMGSQRASMTYCNPTPRLWFISYQTSIKEILNIAKGETSQDITSISTSSLAFITRTNYG